MAVKWRALRGPFTAGSWQALNGRQMATLRRAICDKKWLAMLPFLPFVALTETTNGPFMSCLLGCFSHQSSSDATVFLVDPNLHCDTLAADSSGTLAWTSRSTLEIMNLVFFVLTWSPLLSMSAFHALSLGVRGEHRAIRIKQLPRHTSVELNRQHF